MVSCLIDAIEAIDPDNTTLGFQLRRNGPGCYVICDTNRNDLQFITGCKRKEAIQEFHRRVSGMMEEMYHRQELDALNMLVYDT